MNRSKTWACIGLTVLAASWLGGACASAGVDDTGPLSADDFKSYAGYFAGTYTVVGRLPGADAAYCGKVVFASKGKDFAVTRTIDGKITEGKAFVDLDAAGNRILVMQFTQAGGSFEAAYLFKTNYDHYPRLTGHVTKPGESKGADAGYGVEALFPADDPPCAVVGS